MVFQGEIQLVPKEVLEVEVGFRPVVQLLPRDKDDALVPADFIVFFADSHTKVCGRILGMLVKILWMMIWAGVVCLKL